jgi:hypothetical protein
MKLLRAFVTTDSVIPVLNALRAAGGRPVVLPLDESTNSEYEALLESLVSDRLGVSRVVKIRAICGDEDADRSVAAVTTAAQTASEEPAVVIVTPWNGADTASRLRGGAMRDGTGDDAGASTPHRPEHSIVTEETRKEIDQ